MVQAPVLGPGTEKEVRHFQSPAEVPLSKQPIPPNAQRVCQRQLMHCHLCHLNGRACVVLYVCNNPECKNRPFTLGEMSKVSFFSSSSTHFSSNLVIYEGYIFKIFILVLFSIMCIYVIHLLRTLIYTRRSLVKMDKAQEKLLINIPRRALHWLL